jgi:hypothetical protein
MEELQCAEGWAITRKTENTGFTCAHCGARVDPLPTGSYRNHCPNCLWLVHLDDVPGDRASSCRGPTRQIGVDFRAPKGFVVMHRCQKCSAERRNKAAPDDIDALIALMRARPVTNSRRSRTSGRM